MIRTQYALIPVKFLEIKNSSKKTILFSFKTFLINKLTKPKFVIAKVSIDKKPYIEELITKRKIGLNKNDGFNIYLKGNVIYSLCSKEEAYAKIINIVNYEDAVIRLFNS